MAEITIIPTKKQQEAWDFLFDDYTKFILFGAGAGCGKSWMMCEYLLMNAIGYRGSRQFLARNELKRLMNTTFITFKKVCKHHNIPLDTWTLDGKYNVIKFQNGSTIDLLDVAHKPTDADFERFGSSEYTFGVGDEVGEWHFDAFDVLKSRLGRHNCYDLDSHQIITQPSDYETHPENYPNIVNLPPKFFLSCNPTLNWLYSTFYKPWKEGDLDPKYAFIPALFSDNPHTATSYREQLSEIKNETNRQRLMEGNWEYDTDPTRLFNYDALTDLRTNTIEEDLTKYITVDVARFGVDRTVVALWEGLNCYEIHTYAKTSIDEVVDIVKAKAAEHRIPYSKVIGDEDGLGAGFIDGMRGIKGFVGGRKPFDVVDTRTGQIVPANFQNLRAQCYHKLGHMVNQHEIVISVEDPHIHEQIKEELAVIKQKDADKDFKKFQVIGKNEIKESLGRSPDLADVLMMRMYFELANPNKVNARAFNPIDSMLNRDRGQGGIIRGNKTTYE